MENREISAEELAEKLNTTSRTLLGWLGSGQKSNQELCKNYETYYGEDKKKYIRRKEK
mgnify:CR=1 FL=1